MSESGYNIFTTANESYFPFVYALVQSILLNCDKCKNIYIVDAGLGEYRKYLTDNNKVIIMDTNSVDGYSGVHSEGWVNATQQKTLNLKKLLYIVDFTEPLIMIDSDVCVMNDLSESIDKNFDIQVTTMHDGGHCRSDGQFISEIASYLIINNPNVGKRFVEKWIKNMTEFRKNGKVFPHETPALNTTIEENDFNIGYLNELHVCADVSVPFYEVPIKTAALSLHFKSSGATNYGPIDNFRSRVGNLKHHGQLKFDINKYLYKPVIDDWMSKHK